jgi:hypothetical protein
MRQSDFGDVVTADGPYVRASADDTQTCSGDRAAEAVISALSRRLNTEPGPTKRRVQRHDAVFEQPHHKARVKCPARLSMTNSIRSGGSSSSSVSLTVRPVCHRCHTARLSASGKIFAIGSESRMADNSVSNQACSTTFGQLVTPLTRTWPVD